MSVNQLERVLWRLRNRLRRHGLGEVDIPIDKLRVCIMLECGTDPRTVKKHIDALVALGWVELVDSERFSLTSEDLRVS